MRAGRGIRRGGAADGVVGPVPAVVWGIVALHGLLLVVASVLYPTYRAPDESAHVDMVVAVAGTAGYPGLGERQISQRVMDSHAVVGHDRTGERTPLVAGDAPPRGERPSFADLGPDRPSDVVQQMAAHPPLYYEVAGTALSAARVLVPGAGDWAFDRVVGFLRLLGALMVLPLPLLAYRTARRLDAPEPAAVTAAMLPVGIPQLTHIGASVNNDTLLVLLVAGLTLPVLAAAQGDTRVRLALGTGVLAGLAMLTKGFAIFVPLWIAGAYALAAVRGGGWRSLAAGAGAVAAATAVGGWWWVRNLVTFGTVQPSGLPSPPPPEGFVPDLGSWSAFFVRRLSVRFWIEPNVLPDGVPPVDLLASLVVVVCCVAAFVGHRELRQRPADLAVVLGPLAGLAGIVVFGAWRVYARTGTPFAIHGRYLYGAVVGIAVVAALGAVALLGARARWLPPGALATAAAVQLGAGGLALAEYWGPPGLGERVAAVLAWSPWPGPLLVALSATAAALAAWLWVVLLRDARPQARTPDRR